MVDGRSGARKNAIARNGPTRSKDGIDRLALKRAAWEQATASAPERPVRFMTTSSEPIARLYDPTDLADWEFERDVGYPGEFPFTRGVHPTGYRGRLWTMRMFAGFGSAEETNARFRYLLDHGQTGLSIAFDMPTLYGYDTDDEHGVGEYGTCGVAVSSLADMEILLDGIPVDQISTSMTISSPAAVIWAMYLVIAEKRGIPLERLQGTIQNDILKEYTAQNEYIFPPEPSMRLVLDTVEFGTRRVPKWNTISISGYHMREAGATALQELAFTLADGIEYVRWGIDRGLDVDSFAPRLSFFFDFHNDFFEEIAKVRAARRIWARVMRERFGARSERSCWMRFHSQTAGVSLFEQQPELNIVRTTIQALAAVLGGTQSLHTNSMDEAISLPTDHAARIALRTQQIIAHESGVTNTVDPLGGSYFVEALTDRMEHGVYKYWERIEALGGVIPAIQAGFFQREIADSAYRYQREIDAKERIVVGVNEFLVDEPPSIPIHKIVPEGERRHLERLARVRRERDNLAVAERLDALKVAAGGRENLMPYLMEAVRAYATLGEITAVLRAVWGVHQELVVV
jgi:methylmalonyl-CoA mutase N-terminal domain/subunit